MSTLINDKVKTPFMRADRNRLMSWSKLAKEENLLKNRLGDAALSLVERSIVKYQGCKILLVTCPESPQEVWIDETKFFVRSHPATDELKGPALTSYIKRRLPS